MLDLREIKDSASGRWMEILTQVAGIDESLLDGKHHPCPLCGGRDRFRLLNRESGAVYCNQCFNQRNGDGIAAVQWMHGNDFRDAMRMVADYLGLSDSERKELNIVEEIARRKRIPLESFRAYGGHEDKRGKMAVARVPMFGPDGNPCGDFDMSTMDKGWEKGKVTQGSESGLFIREGERPVPGDTVYLTEGVKDAAALDSQGYSAIGYCGKMLHQKFVGWFQKCHVVIVPDRDIPGMEAAQKTAAKLYGVASSVRIAHLPAEVKETGGDGVREVLFQSEGKRKLKEALDSAVTWTPEGEEAPPKIIRLSVAAKQHLDRLAEGGETTWDFGLDSLDYATGGCAPGEMVVVAARPGHGKSMLAMQLLDNASKVGRSGLIISEEMSGLALGRRAVTYLSDVPEEYWYRDINRVKGQVESYFATRKPIWIAEGCGTAKRAVEAIDRAVEKDGVQMVAVDYAQLLRSKGSSRYEKVTETSIALKQAIAKHNVALLLLCQMGRDIEKRPGHVPNLSDLKESGQIEQDADLVLSPQWPLKFDPSYKPIDEYRIYVLKSRNREIRETLVNLKIEPSRQRVVRKERFNEQYEAAINTDFGF